MTFDCIIQELNALEIEIEIFKNAINHKKSSWVGLVPMIFQVPF